MIVREARAYYSNAWISFTGKTHVQCAELIGMMQPENTVRGLTVYTRDKDSTIVHEHVVEVFRMASATPLRKDETNEAEVFKRATPYGLQG